MKQLRYTVLALALVAAPAAAGVLDWIRFIINPWLIS